MAAQRHIRRLRLSCARREQAEHGRVLLEDALRTASLGDEGRLIVVRRLDLGPISARATATQWSRRLEDRYRSLRSAPVSVLQPGAVRAEAVYFSSQPEAWMLLAQRAAMGQPISEWYWPPAVPGWAPGGSAVETLRLSFRQLALAGLAVTLQLALRLAERHALTPLLQALQPGDFQALQGALGMPRSRDTAGVGRRKASDLAAGSVSAPRDAGRTHWLAAVKLTQGSVASERSPVPTPPTPAAIRALVERWSGEAENLRAPSPREGTLAEASAEPMKPARGSAPPADKGGRARSPAGASSFWGGERLVTRAGGLFFLIPLLTRAGLPEAAAKLSEDEGMRLPWQVLRLALRHARIASDDALFRELAALPEATQPLGGWLIKANRHALRLTGLNVRRLVVRPALVAATPTHVDVFFRATDAAIRVRRAGLDIDPGWVPWLRRAVTFHFNRED